ncbi:hypothetical protein R1T16_07195, partial [Flavobacterium sp. DG1-102-2]|uniref:hypothetical protein n=1 Tax=Flavobacterium sp. DG1-102-2 TaxID=3081663 RepID=UPI00294938E1
MNNKYLLLLLLSIFGFSSYSQQGPAVPTVTIVPGSPICNPGDCTELTASYFDTGETSSYTVQSIPFNPPYSFSGANANVIPVIQDDFWSDIVDIFPFCFYGQRFDKILINANGAITFSIANIVPGGQYVPGSSVNWQLNGTPIPTAVGGGAVTNMSIFGVLQDTNPADGANASDQSINWEVFGTAPNRVFIFNIYKTKHFACGSSPDQTSQMVLYETTNIIEVYIKDRGVSAGCTWNGNGKAVVGLQKDTTTGIAAPGMNNTSFTANNVAWRFKPNGPSVVSFDWFDGATLIGTGNPLPICPAVDTNYTVNAKYTMCDGSQVTVTDDYLYEVPDPLPINDIGEIVLCGDQPSFTVDLTEINDEVLNGLDPDLNMLTVYLDEAARDGNYSAMTSSEMMNFTINQGEEYTIYGRIEDYMTACVTTFEYVVKVGVQPTATEPADMQVCDTGADNIEVFDLTTNDATILGTQDPADFVVSYHTTLAGANANDNSIADASAFSSGNATVFVRVTNTANADCFKVISFDLIVTPSPSVVAPADGFACSNVGYTLPVLTSGNYYTGPGGTGTQLAQSSIVTTSQTIYVYAQSGTLPNNCSAEDSFVVTIYPSPDVPEMTDIQACESYELPALTTGNYYTGAGGTGTLLPAGTILTTDPANTGATVHNVYIYAVTGDATTVCSDESDFVVTLYPIPTVNPATPLEECADNFDGFAYFDLTQAGAEILNGTTGLLITYHETQLGAEFGTNPIPTPANYHSINGTVYASVLPQGSTTNCRTVVPIQLIVNPRPAVPVMTVYALCDDDTDGFAEFDLTTKDAQANGGDATLTVTYHLTQADAQGGQNAITPANAYSNTSAGQQQIWVSVTTGFGCRSVAPLTLRVNPLPVLNPDPNAFIATECEEVPGEAEFHLEEIAQAIAGGAPNYTVTFYETLAQAEFGGTDYLNTPYLSGAGFIYARIVDDITGCYTTHEVELRVIPAPIATPPAPIQECDFNNDGYARFDMTDAMDAIEAALADVAVTAYETPEDAEHNVNAIPNPDDYTNVDQHVQTIYLRVQSTLTDCYDIVTLQL